MFVVLAGTVQSQSIYSGVSSGMVFDYKLSSYWSSDDPNVSSPAELAIINQISHIEVRISDVNDTHIFTTNICYYNNDKSNTIDRGIINFYTGEVSGVYSSDGYIYTNEGYGFAAIIGADLNVGDVIHPNGTDGLKILDATTRAYENGDRLLNHVCIVDDDLGGDYVWTRDLYFDKETGVLVEQLDRTESTTTPASVAQVTWKLSSVSGVDNWVIPREVSNKNTIMIAIIVTVMAIIVVIALRIMRNKKD